VKPCLGTTPGGAHVHAPQANARTPTTQGHLTPTHTIGGKSNKAMLTVIGCVSDIRLKRNIVKLARLDNSLNLYRFRYTWSDTVYVGVLAQDVLAICPEAVVHNPDGYMRVNYRRLGLRMLTWAEWTGSQGEHSRRAA
jgi:hypothetical protein